MSEPTPTLRPPAVYPYFLCELLEQCPTAGKGVHPWLHKVSRYLHAFHTFEEMHEILEVRTANCGRVLEPHEIPDAIKNSWEHRWIPGSGQETIIERRAAWLLNPVAKPISFVPDFDPEAAKAEAARIGIDITPEWLKAHSPTSASISTGQYLQTIFLHGERVVIFNRYKSQGDIWPFGQSIKQYSQIHHPEGAWFLCNPVDGQEHYNPRTGRRSQRSMESVTAWRYAVLECDHEPKEEWWPIWLKILVQLKLKIVSLTTSGGKSVHALVRVDCASKEEWDAFKAEHLRPLVRLGACDGSLWAVRLTRLPGCYRGQNLQELLYLNPEADGTPIFNPSENL
jgi:hypothetical protein